jgi:hypothetical protein
LPSAEPSRDTGTTATRWAGSPAASWLTAPRPNGPSPWPSGWAVSTPPRRSWARPGRRCAKPSVATASACRPATLRSCASAPSPSPANGMGGRPFPGLDPVFVALNLASSPPENGRRPSCTSGSGARSSTPSWAPTWWSSCTAKVTPAGQPPGRGRSSDGPSAAIGWLANAPAASSGAMPTELTARPGPSSPRSGRRRPMLADPPVSDALKSTLMRNS